MTGDSGRIEIVRDEPNPAVITSYAGYSSTETGDGPTLEEDEAGSWPLGCLLGLVVIAAVLGAMALGMWLR